MRYRNNSHLTDIVYITILYSSISYKGVVNLSSIDLIILGYLKYGEKSAYEMVKEFESWNMHYWLKISNPSIYKNIIKLSENGYLDSRIVKESEMPEKTIYSINEKGCLYFHELMKYSSNHMGNFYFDFSAFIVNIGLLPEDERNSRLQDFKKQFSERKTMVALSHEEKAKLDKPEGARILMGLYRELYELLDKWSDEVLKHYNLPIDK